MKRQRQTRLTCHETMHYVVLFLFLFLLVACLPEKVSVQDSTINVHDDSKSAPTISVPLGQQTATVTETTPMSTVSSPIRDATATEIPSPTSPLPSPTPTDEPGEVALGRIYQLSTAGIYSWSDVVSVNEELMVGRGDVTPSIFGEDAPYSPANSVRFAFSHYSGQLVYWTETYPSELWISDVAYEQPRRIFTDTKGNYVDDTLTPASGLNLVWSPDDSLILIYLFDRTMPHLIYDAQTGAVGEWFWVCHDVIISPRTGEFAVLCVPDKEQGITSETTFAILERGGDVWYSPERPGDVVSQALSDSIIPWQISADGTRVAYYDPNDPGASLLIADTDGNVQRLLPGSSVLQKDERITNYEAQYYESFTERDRGFFRWSRDGELLLAYGLGGSEHPCRSLIDEETGQSYETPCWQVIDVDTGQVIWTDLDSTDTLFQNSYELETMPIIQAEFAPKERMTVVRGQYFSDELLAIINLDTFVAHRFSPLPYAETYWAETPSN